MHHACGPDNLDLTFPHEENLHVNLARGDADCGDGLQEPLGQSRIHPRQRLGPERLSRLLPRQKQFLVRTALLKPDQYGVGANFKAADYDIRAGQPNSGPIHRSKGLSINDCKPPGRMARNISERQFIRQNRRRPTHMKACFRFRRFRLKPNRCR